MLNIDASIVILYLIFTLYVGIKYGRGTKSIESFATGGRNFSTPTLAATIAATYVSGSSFVICIQYAYMDGMVKLGTLCSMFMIGNLFVPRIKEFLGNLSVAEVMGKLYGNEARMITAIAGFIASVGLVAMQLKVLATFFAYFGSIDTTLAVILSAIVLTFYSAFGGIRAVVFTDFMQFATFMIVVPLIAISLWSTIDFYNNTEASQVAIDHLFSFRTTSWADYITFFCLSVIPTLEPGIFQRILIGRSVKQVSNAFNIAAIIYFCYISISAATGVMLFAYNSNVELNQLFGFMIDEFAFTGVKGIAFVAILSMAMSTADSHLNSASVVFSHDFYKILRPKISGKHELMVSQFFVVLIGATATIFALYFQDLITLLLFTKNFYMPVVSVPLILLILGFRSTRYAVLIGMFAGFSTMACWKLYQYYNPGILNFDSLIPGMLANIIFFMGSHYLLNQPGGWVGPSDSTDLKYNSEERSKNWNYFKMKMNQIFTAFIRPTAHTLDIKTSSIMYVLLGVILIFSYSSIALSVQPIVEDYNLLYLHFTTFIFATLLISKPLWDKYISNNISMSFILLSLAYLIYSSSLMMFIYGFVAISVISLIIHLVIIAFFLDILTSVIISVVSILASYVYFSNYYGIVLYSEYYRSSIILLYSIFMIAVILLIFFRRQENEFDFILSDKDRKAKMIAMLQESGNHKDQSLDTAINLRGNIIANISHEIRTPMQALESNIDLLCDFWNDPKMKEYVPDMLDNIREDMKRFHDYAGNLLDLSQYSKGRMMFNIKNNNIKELLESLVKSYNISSIRKGKANNYRSVTLKYSKNTPENIQCDALKVDKVISNILNNANKYSKECIVEINVSKSNKKIVSDGKNWDAILIEISDKGVGIPEIELRSIFEPFQESSRTKNNAGGRGLSLSICKNIIEAHMGKIWAKNNKSGVGSTFNILLPIEHPYSNFLDSPINKQ